jgi:sodium-dependent dicarboxylate transporter 2/3/5
MQTIWQRLKPHSITILLAIIFIAAGQLHLYQQWIGISYAEEVTLTILLITALFWVTESLPLYITSLGVLAMCILWLLPILHEQGATVENGVFYQAFFGDITLLFMGGFVLSALLNKYGLAHRMANWVLSRTGDSPARVLLGIILISALLSMWMSNTATAAMMFAIISPIILQLKASPFARGMAIAIPFACNIGGLGTPIGTPPNAIAMEYLQQEGMDLSFAGWMLLSLPFVILLLYLLWVLVLKRYAPGDLKISIEESAQTSGFTVRQYLVMAIFGVTILGWLTTSYTGLTSGMVGLLALILSFGIGLLQTPDFRNISWDILFMLGGGLCLGVALNQSGLTSTIANAIPGSLGFWPILVLLLILGAIMTTFMSNTATANLLIPVAVSLSGNAFVFAVGISIMCSTSMALPVSTPPNAIAFGSGLLKSRDMITSGLLITLIALVLTILGAAFYFPLF